MLPGVVHDVRQPDLGQAPHLASYRGCSLLPTQPERGWISGISGSCRCDPVDKTLPGKTVEQRFMTNAVGLITFTGQLLRSHNLNEMQLHLKIWLGPYFFIFCLTQTCSEESNAAELEPLVTPLSSYLGPAECRHADVHGLISGGSGWPRCVIQTHSVFCLPRSQTWGSALQRSRCLLGHIEPVASEVKIISKHHTYLCKYGNLHFSTLKSHIGFIEFVTGRTAFYLWHSAPCWPGTRTWDFGYMPFTLLFTNICPANQPPNLFALQQHRLRSLVSSL